MRLSSSLVGLPLVAVLVACPSGPTPDDDDDSTGLPVDDDDSGSQPDDDDSAEPAFFLPPVSATIDSLCRRVPPAGDVVDWSMQTEWVLELAAPEQRQVWDLLATGLVVPTGGSEDGGPAPARVLAALMTTELGPCSFCTDELAGFGGVWVIASQADGEVDWSQGYHIDSEPLPPTFRSAIVAGDFDGDELLDDLFLPFVTSEQHPLDEGTWPSFLQTDGTTLAETLFEEDLPFPRHFGHATSYRPTWIEPADLGFVGGWSYWLDRDAIGGVEWPDANRGQYDAGEWLPVDANLDGVLDLPTGLTVLDGVSGVQWTAFEPESPWNETDWSLAPVNGDCDAWPEFVAIGVAAGDDVLYEWSVRLFDHDGTEAWSYVHPFGEYGALPEARPAFGDLDGDGQPEIVVRFYLPWEEEPETEIVALGLDGQSRWAAPLPEPSSVRPHAAPALFDFDGDGDMEVVAQTLDAIYLLDGEDGAVLSSVGNWNPGTMVQPMVADVDGDGSAEIVAHNRGWGSTTEVDVETHGLRVLGPATGSWAPAPPQWDQAAWQAARWLRQTPETGGAPPFWREHNSLRAQVALYEAPQPDDTLPNPQIATAVLDRTGCPDSLDVWVAVRNTGTGATDALEVQLRDASGNILDSSPIEVLEPGVVIWVVFPGVGLQAEQLELEVLGGGEQCDSCDDAWPVFVSCSGAR